MGNVNPALYDAITALFAALQAFLPIGLYSSYITYITYFK
jgi:hypothetical protein